MYIYIYVDTCVHGSIYACWEQVCRLYAYANICTLARKSAEVIAHIFEQLGKGT